MLLCLFLLFLLFPVASTQGAKAGITLCLSSAVPSLFPFMVLSRMLTASGVLCHSNVLTKGMARFFHLSPAGVSVLLIGSVCGYPMGAKTTSDLLKQNKLSHSEATYLMTFCNNGGPAFAIATVGAVYFQSTAFGVKLFVCHIVGALLAGSLLRLFFRNPTLESLEKSKEKLPFFTLLTEGIRDGFSSVLQVSGVVIFFSALFAVLKQTGMVSLLGGHLPWGEAIFCGLLEMTAGLQALASLQLPPQLSLGFASLLFGFGGISILCQCLSFLAPCGIKTAPCLWGKTLCALLSVLLSWLWSVNGIAVILFAALWLLVTSAIEKPDGAVQIGGKGNPNHIGNKHPARRRI